MLKNIARILLCAVMVSVFLDGVGYGAEKTGEIISRQSYHNEKGLSHFKNGLYNLTPKKQKKEASEEYRLAIEEFTMALSIDPEFAEAHRNLARVYYVKKQYLKAAEHYKKLTTIDPYDIDAYLYAAAALERAVKYDEAISELESPYPL